MTQFIDQEDLRDFTEKNRSVNVVLEDVLWYLFKRTKLGEYVVHWQKKEERKYSVVLGQQQGKNH